MNKLSCSIVLFFNCIICNAQNLVPNGDFEQYSGCPDYTTQVDSLLFWFNPCSPPYGTIGTLSGSSDFYHACASPGNVGVPVNAYAYQPAHSGSGYAGFAMYNDLFYVREYIEVPLTSPLIANTVYKLEMYLNLADICKYGIDSIGVYFSDTLIAGLHSHVALPYIPQIKSTSGYVTDTLSWTLISETFTASGGESYMILGNFEDDANTDTMNMIVNAPFRYAYYFIDDVSLTSLTGAEETNQPAEIKIFPNPVFNSLNVTISDHELSEITISDMAARKLMQKKFTKTVSLNTEQLSKGIYLYEVRNRNGVIKKGMVVKD